MKKLIFTICAILSGIFLLSSCENKEKEVYLFSYFTQNGQDGLHLAYSYDGLKWESLKGGASFLAPQIGKNKLMRDPCIVRDNNGTFHMVWTPGWWERRIGYASSKDLVNWSVQQEIPVMAQFEGTKNSWAPELFYDSESEIFYIFWASTVPGAFPELATSESEKGLNHRQYYVTTKDFKNFSATKLFFNPGFSVIDGTIVKHDNLYHLIVKNENSAPAEKNLRITSAPRPFDFPTEVSEPITGDYWAEGPSPLKVGDYVYVYFDKYMEGKYGAIRSRDMKNWEDVSDSISFPKGVRHGTAFTVPLSMLDSLLKK